MKSADRALVVFGREDNDAVRPLLEALDNHGCLSGALPEAPELSKRWRVEARELVDRSDVGLFVVSESSIRSPLCMWLLGELSNRQKRVVLLFTSPIRLT